MVNQKGLRHIEDLTVHPDGELFSAVPDLSLGVVGASASGGVPFVFSQAWIVIGVRDSVLALREWDSSKGVAKAQPPVAQSEPDGNACQPSWDSDSQHHSQDAFSGGGTLRGASIMGRTCANLTKFGFFWECQLSVSGCLAGSKKNS
jgi:hypothetical protein